MALAIKFFIAAAIGYCAVAALLYALQDRMMLFATTDSTPMPAAPPTIPWMDEGIYKGAIGEAMGSRVHGTVLVLHGNAGTVKDRLYYVTALTELGYRVVLMEYPGYGARPGKAKISELVRAMRHDVCRGSRWGEPVYLAGESLGAGLAAQAAAACPERVQGILLITPWSSLVRLARERFPLFPVRFLLHERLDSVQALQGFTRPVVVLAAENDEIIPSSHARELAAAIPGAHLEVLSGQDHNSWPLALTPADWARWMSVLATRDAG